MDLLLTVLILIPIFVVLAFAAWISYLVVARGWRSNRLPPLPAAEPTPETTEVPVRRAPANQASRPPRRQGGGRRRR